MSPLGETPSATNPRRSGRFVSSRARGSAADGSIFSGYPMRPVVVGGAGSSLVGGVDACLAHKDKSMLTPKVAATIPRPTALSLRRRIWAAVVAITGGAEV